MNQDISIDERVRAIESTLKFKASGPDNIPIELFLNHSSIEMKIIILCMVLVSGVFHLLFNCI